MLEYTIATYSSFSAARPRQRRKLAYLRFISGRFRAKATKAGFGTRIKSYMN